MAHKARSRTDVRARLLILKLDGMKPLFNKYLLKTLLITLFATLCTVGKTSAQEVSDETAIDAVIEMIVEPDGENEAEAEELKEMLSDMAESKIDINRATRRQLEMLPFLSPLQVENLLYYVYAYGPMQSLDELLIVEGIDRHTAQLLRTFLTAGSGATATATTLAQMFRHGHSRLTSKVRRTLNDKKGYADVDEATRQQFPGSYYVGSPFYNSVKYAYSYRDMMSIGVTAEKDAGEQFFKGSNAKGYDFYSAHFFVRDIGIVKALAIGDYKASFGRGLVVSNDYYMGKNVYMSSLHNRKGGLRRHSSTDENNFLRGAGVTLGWERLELTTFYSFRRLDATVENSLISALKNDGYHRLRRDLDARNAVANHVIGSNLTYQGRFFNTGLTIVGDFFNKPFTRGDAPYRAFYPEGKRFFNASLSYSFRWRNIFAGGETAVDGRGNFATINSIDIYPASGYRLYLMQRHFGKGYVAHHSRTMSSNGQTRNEKGLSCGIEVTAIRSLDISLAVDCYAHPWLRYGIDRPSSGSEIMARAVYVPRQDLTFRAYYRRKSTERDHAGDDGSQWPAWTHTDKLRAGLVYTGCKTFEIKTDIDCCIASRQGQGKSRGIALTQSASCHIPHTPLRVAAVFSLFDTDNYDSRIYIPTKNLPQTFYYPAVYGQGTYFSLLAQCNIGASVSIALNCALTAFDHTDTVGSGPEEINGNIRSEVAAFVNIRF